jgi:hypothetical protein
LVKDGNGVFSSRPGLALLEQAADAKACRSIAVERCARDNSFASMVVENVDTVRRCPGRR